MAEAVAETRPREERAHALGGAVKAIDEDPRTRYEGSCCRGRALELLIGMRKGGGTRVRGIAQMPEHGHGQSWSQIDFVRETTTVLLIRQENTQGAVAHTG